MILQKDLWSLDRDKTEISLLLCLPSFYPLWNFMWNKSNEKCKLLIFSQSPVSHLMNTFAEYIRAFYSSCMYSFVFKKQRKEHCRVGKATEDNGHGGSRNYHLFLSILLLSHRRWLWSCSNSEQLAWQCTKGHLYSVLKNRCSRKVSCDGSSCSRDSPVAWAESQKLPLCWKMQATVGIFNITGNSIARGSC